MDTQLIHTDTHAHIDDHPLWGGKRITRGGKKKNNLYEISNTLIEHNRILTCYREPVMGLNKAAVEDVTLCLDDKPKEVASN